MNESHPIDDLFRGRLKEYEMSPPMQLWDAIEQKRRPKPASGGCEKWAAAGHRACW
jgi:hypothetical protein